MKLEAVNKVLNDEKVQEVADSLAVVNYSVIYEWIRNWRTKGSAGLMDKKEQIEEGIYETKAQPKKELPHNIGELKELTARLGAERALLEQELELAKKSMAASRENRQRDTRRK
ncbi:MAG: helix-turn-helix domain-containing protein [Tannerellaceae bacterium]